VLRLVEGEGVAVRERDSEAVALRDALVEAEAQRVAVADAVAVVVGDVDFVPQPVELTVPEAVVEREGLNGPRLSMAITSPAYDVGRTRSGGSAETRAEMPLVKRHVAHGSCRGWRKPEVGRGPTVDELGAHHDFEHVVVNVAILGMGFPVGGVFPMVLTLVALRASSKRHTDREGDVRGDSLGRGEIHVHECTEHHVFK
jgi:hypothetical protein